MTDIRDKIFGMSGSARAVLSQLFMNGPTWDGDLVDKCGRGDLVKLGYAERWNGWQWLTRKGIEFAITSMDMGREKEQRKR